MVPEEKPQSAGRRARQKGPQDRAISKGEVDQVNRLKWGRVD